MPSSKKTVKLQRKTCLHQAWRLHWIISWWGNRAERRPIHHCQSQIYVRPTAFILYHDQAQNRSDDFRASSQRDKFTPLLAGLQIRLVIFCGMSIESRAAFQNSSQLPNKFIIKAVSFWANTEDPGVHQTESNVEVMHFLCSYIFAKKIKRKILWKVTM